MTVKPSADAGGNAWSPQHAALCHAINPGNRSISADELFAALKAAPELDVNAFSVDLRFISLTFSAARRSVQHLEVLKAFGANFKAQSHGRIPVMFVAVSADVVRWLHAQGSDIEARSADGSTPLHHQASQFGNGSAAALLELGANVQAKNNEGQTCLHSLAAHGYGAFELDKDNLTSFLGTLMAAGVDFEAQDTTGRTALHRAAYRGLSQMVCALIETGANTEAVCNWGLRPVQLAVDQEHEGCVFALNAMGASMQGTISRKTTLNGFVHESRLVSAARSGSLSLMKAHLERFSSPAAEDIARVKKLPKRDDTASVKAFLHAHLAAQAVECVLAGLTSSGPSGPSGPIKPSKPSKPSKPGPLGRSSSPRSTEQLKRAQR